MIEVWSTPKTQRRPRLEAVCGDEGLELDLNDDVVVCYGGGAHRRGRKFWVKFDVTELRKMLGEFTDFCEDDELGTWYVVRHGSTVLDYIYRTQPPDDRELRSDYDHMIGPQVAYVHAEAVEAPPRQWLLKQVEETALRVKSAMRTLAFLERLVEKT